MSDFDNTQDEPVALTETIEISENGGEAIELHPDGELIRIERGDFSPEQIFEYIHGRQWFEDGSGLDDYDLATIDTCVRIIGAYEVGDPKRSARLIAAACESIFEWMGDYGVLVSDLAIMCDPHDEIMLDANGEPAAAIVQHNTHIEDILNRARNDAALNQQLGDTQ